MVFINETRHNRKAYVKVERVHRSARDNTSRLKEYTLKVFETNQLANDDNNDPRAGRVYEVVSPLDPGVPVRVDYNISGRLKYCVVDTFLDGVLHYTEHQQAQQLHDNFECKFKVNKVFYAGPDSSILLGDMVLKTDPSAASADFATCGVRSTIESFIWVGMDDDDVQAVGLQRPTFLDDGATLPAQHYGGHIGLPANMSWKTPIAGDAGVHECDAPQRLAAHIADMRRPKILWARIIHHLRSSDQLAMFPPQGGWKTRHSSMGSHRRPCHDEDIWDADTPASLGFVPGPSRPLAAIQPIPVVQVLPPPPAPTPAVVVVPPTPPPAPISAAAAAGRAGAPASGRAAARIGGVGVTAVAATTGGTMGTALAPSSGTAHLAIASWRLEGLPYRFNHRPSSESELRSYVVDLEGHVLASQAALNAEVAALGPEKKRKFDALEELEEDWPAELERTLLGWAQLRKRQRVLARALE